MLLDLVQSIQHLFAGFTQPSNPAPTKTNHIPPPPPISPTPSFSTGSVKRKEPPTGPASQNPVRSTPSPQPSLSASLLSRIQSDSTATGVDEEGRAVKRIRTSSSVSEQSRVSTPSTHLPSGPRVRSNPSPKPNDHSLLGRMTPTSTTPRAPTPNKGSPNASGLQGTSSTSIQQVAARESLQRAPSSGSVATMGAQLKNIAINSTPSSPRSDNMNSNSRGGQASSGFTIRGAASQVPSPLAPPPVAQPVAPPKRSLLDRAGLASNEAPSSSGRNRDGNRGGNRYGNGNGNGRAAGNSGSDGDVGSAASGGISFLNRISGGAQASSNTNTNDNRKTNNGSGKKTTQGLSLAQRLGGARGGGT